MTMFDRGAAVLASLHTQNMEDWATIEREDQVRRPAGGYDTVYVEERIVPCVLIPLSGAELEAAGRQNPETKWKLHLPAGTDLDPLADGKVRRITVRGSRPGLWQQQLRVTGPLGPRSMEVVRYLLCANWA